MMPMKVLMLIVIIAAIFFAAQGIHMHKEVPAAEAEYHEVLESYFSENKAVRDSAPVGSTLLDDLVEIQQTPSTLMELKLLGLGKILTGIFFMLFAILIALMAMPVRLKAAIKK